MLVMEDFVPYEFAVKLKEKGFREKCFAFYYKQGGFQWNCMRANTGLVNVSWACLNHNDIINGEKINAPTISQVLKWLREEKKIYIMIDRSFSVKNSWHYIICNNDDFEHLIQQESIPNRKWEQAAITGIEYCLDNLI